MSLVAESATIPRYQNLSALRFPTDVPSGVIFMNFLASALWTVGVLSAIYAGLLDPEFRVTASTLSSVINGVATIMMFILIDPYLASLTDDVVREQVREDYFRRVVVWMIASRFAGTLAAQVLLIPAAHLIVLIARTI